MVRKRCKYLRDTYVRAKRKRLNGERRTPKEDYLLQKMQFLERRRAETNSQLASENKPVFDTSASSLNQDYSNNIENSLCSGKVIDLITIDNLEDDLNNLKES